MAKTYIIGILNLCWGQKYTYFSGKCRFCNHNWRICKAYFLYQNIKNRGWCFKPLYPKERRIAHRYIIITFLLLCNYVTFYLMTFKLLLLLFRQQMRNPSPKLHATLQCTNGNKNNKKESGMLCVSNLFYNFIKAYKQVPTQLILLFQKQ